MRPPSITTYRTGIRGTCEAVYRPCRITACSPSRRHSVTTIRTLPLRHRPRNAPSGRKNVNAEPPARGASCTVCPRSERVPPLQAVQAHPSARTVHPANPTARQGPVGPVSRAETWSSAARSPLPRDGMRIPVKPITRSGGKPITCSGANRSPVPTQTDHLSERSDAGRES